jgi:hypothetical protein
VKVVEDLLTRLGLFVLVVPVVLVGPEVHREALAAAPTLVGRAVLPAATFSPGPTSGELIGAGPIND